MSNDLSFIKVDLRSFQDICEELETLKAQRNRLGEFLMEFADEVEEGWKCGDGSFHSSELCSFENRFDREFCYHCNGCSAGKGKILHFKAGNSVSVPSSLFVEGI